MAAERYQEVKNAGFDTFFFEDNHTNIIAYLQLQ